jgi:hypothetical protein
MECGTMTCLELENKYRKAAAIINQMRFKDAELQEQLSYMNRRLKEQDSMIGFLFKMMNDRAPETDEDRSSYRAPHAIIILVA